MEDRFWSKVDKSGGPDECWPWTAALSNTGYGQFMLDYQPQQAHRIAWYLIHGLIPKGKWVLHHCDNKVCCNPAHLFLGTQSDNMIDMVMKGRQGGQRLTAHSVLEIRKRYKAGGVSYNILAKEYGVSQAHIGRIIHREIWAHLQ